MAIFEISAWNNIRNRPATMSFPKKWCSQPGLLLIQCTIEENVENGQNAV